ncbi:MarR family transcriptional regulator [Peptostreptococcus russellii]|uniref:Transcriptional regulator, MarR family n=1 Tax=Peptostreptococcus russellii TaxID=215200 RepID=A0A1H8ELG3_9FIRM|nr:MarR family transcriptional regulator [Peptostreptococcus russellii]MBC2577547.1 MarR family transcriptional regulator [Peptostreptococcus russellii]SEN19638.1 transcriptional regulator, MarR family [Peptostreptococcus russellii]
MEDLEINKDNSVEKEEQFSDANFNESREVINEIVVELFNNIMMIEEKAVRMRGISNLTMSEIHAIDAIGIGDGKMMSEVAEQLHITMGTLTSTMTKLEKKGYAKRTKDPTDRRVVLASLTRKGELAYKIHKNFHDEMVDRVILDLNLHEDKVLIKSLRNINEFFLKEYLED